MTKSILLKGGFIVNENKILTGDISIKNGRIDKIGSSIGSPHDIEINAEGLYILPGMIDDQVHFREPGLTHKANIATESKAAVAGGITSFMEMPNTVPNTTTQELLKDKYNIGKETSLANYSFFMGATNDNLDEVLRTDANQVCGIKIFMGSSTGNMLVDNSDTLESIFTNTPMLIATHCEDELTIRNNLELAKSKFGEDIPANQHPVIRNAEACFLSSSKAVELAKKHGTRLHILHISSEKELTLFDNKIPLAEKKITAEACIHHLWFCDKDYSTKGNWIKWNPAVKSEYDRDNILKAVLDNRIDVIATDHAPHTIEEKEQKYLQCPSGGPLVQHALVALLELYHQGKISLEQIVEKTSHNVATCFQIKERGFIKEGYWADLAIVDLHAPWKVSKQNILYKCGWSPFEETSFKSSIRQTIVSGNLVYNNGLFNEETKGLRMEFCR